MGGKAAPRRRKTCKDMPEVRAAIDALDREIVALLGDRLHFIAEAARLKNTRDAVRDDARIDDVIAKVRRTAMDINIDPDFVSDLYRDLVERSITLELSLFDRLRATRED